MADDLALVLESWSRVLQDIGSDLYIKAFSNKGIAVLSMVRFRYVELIARQPGVTPGELARTMKVSKPTVANVLSALERQGLARREKSETDGRVSRVFLSKAAQEIVDYRRSMYGLMAVRIRDVLTKEESATIARLMRKSLGPLGKADRGGKD